MTSLEWIETEDGYRSGGYEITRRGASQWSIQVDSTLKPPLRRPRSNDEWTFRSLKSARAAALHLEIVRVRRVKLIRHVTLSIVTFGLAVGCYLTMTAAAEMNQLSWFVLSGFALVASLSEGLDAFVLVVSDGWDYRYEVPKLSVLDRSVSFLIVSTLWPKPKSVEASLEPVSVRVLS